MNDESCCLPFGDRRSSESYIRLQSYLTENTVHFYSQDQPVSDVYGKNKYLLGAFGKLRRATISLVMSVRPSVCLLVIIRLSLDGFSWNLIFQ